MIGFMGSAVKIWQCLASVVNSGARMAKKVQYAAYCVAGKILVAIDSGFAESFENLKDQKLREIEAESNQRVVEAQVKANKKRFEQIEEAKLDAAKADVELKEAKADTEKANAEMIRAKAEALRIESQSKVAERLRNSISAINQAGGQVAFDEENLKEIMEPSTMHISDEQKCPTCDGSGSIEYHDATQDETVMRECPTCRGTGKAPSRAED